MSEYTEKMKSTVISRLDELLEYVHRVGELNKRPIFRIEQYKQLNIWEHELKGKIGIHFESTDDDGLSIWLRVERLKRLKPPPIPDEIKEWVIVGNDPENWPQIKEELIKTLPEKEVQELIEQGVVSESDVTVPLKEAFTERKLKDVIFRLENNPQTKEDIDRYIEKQWMPWSEKEKPKRKTIKIYDSLFSLQQTIEAQGDEQPIELIWGIGIGRWKFEGHTINHPLLEKPIEIEIDRENGAILLRPRNIDPIIEVGAYFALNNQGVDALLRFGKKHFSEMSEEVEFSPYIHESFEPLLREASTRLSESGIYWPDANPDIENREPNDISELLEVTDSWVIFARPRSTKGFIQDVNRFREELKKSKDIDGKITNPAKKLVTELSDEKPSQKSDGLSPLGGSSPSSSSASSKTKQKTELFFPKVFNAEQVQIVESLEKNDGVVVQGPPGTGKTHTIANIICHYLATGRSVLVTSKSESALSVLQDQIPDELRDLTISLLTSERKGMKQLESAVELLASVVSQTNLKELNQQSESYEIRVKKLNEEISKIDKKIKDWGLKQITPIGKRLTGKSEDMTAMELAQLVISDARSHDWLPDEIGSSEKYNPKFTDLDIAEIRTARRNVGNDISYIGKSIPSHHDLPDSANIAAIHDDISTSKKIAESSKSNQVPPLAVSVNDSVDRARKLKMPLQELSDLLDIFENNHWLKQLFYSRLEVLSEFGDYASFDGLLKPLAALMERRQQFVETLVELLDSDACFDKIQVALNKIVSGKRGFGILSFGNKESKNIIDSAKVQGQRPKDTKSWQIILDYVNYKNDMRKFIINWNHVGKELELPKFEYSYESSFKDVKDTYTSISRTMEFSDKWDVINREIAELFPHGVEVSKIIQNKSEIYKTIDAIDLNILRISLGAQREKIQELMEKIKKSDGDITNDIKNLVTNIVGNPEHSSDKIIQKWQELVSELMRIKKLSSNFLKIEDVADKISESGAPMWGNSLKTEPLLETEDNLTPVDWFETWKWKQRKQYLHEIDGSDELTKLSEERLMRDNDLKKAFTTLVNLKTHIGLHMNMTERVQGALSRFVSSFAKIGKGTGKRAPRHRRDAYRAMQDCYGGVPCWIMPTWRVSESLPSDFGSFDLVIIDEASQSDISALPAILRAKKLLIVGDDKQVSPTAAFIKEEKIIKLHHNFLADQPFSELFLPGVSIYDLAKSVFPAQLITLTEHFRCVEPIIRFSMQFYTEPLIPLRVPKSSEKITPPLVDVYVKDGYRDDKSKINEVEAEAIISEIKILVSDPKYKERSIGIVSLIGASQAKYIQDQLLTELGEEVFQEYKITCGGATTFQGKERDIMFLSMAVSAGQGAVMNKREDEQRMNVALSRARDRMYLYRSIQESDLNNQSDLRLKILRHFSSPMPQHQPIDNPIELCESNFERDVYKRLSEKGYNTIPQVKVGAFSIDLVVEGENDKRLAIELDGDRYHPPERWLADWERQRTMERVGWQFWRCWGSTYTLSPDSCIDDLINVLTEMKIFPCKSSDSANIYTEKRIYEKPIEIENNDWDQSDDSIQSLNI